MSLFKKKTPNVGSAVDTGNDEKDDNKVDIEPGVEPNAGTGNYGNEVDTEVEENSSEETTEEQAEAPEGTDTTASEEGIETDDPVTMLATVIIFEMKAGGLSDDTRAMLAKAMSYDADILRAEASGELRGRNAAIEEHLQTLEEGDGVPHPSCGPGASQQATCRSIFDLARKAR